MPSEFATPPSQRIAIEPVALRSAGRRITAVELGIALACGAAATLVVTLIHMQFRVPGHAILKPLLPIALALALVPRPATGSLAGLGALGTALVLLVGGWGELHASALASLVLLGPALDLAERGMHGRTEFIVRCMAAGLIVNLVALGIKLLAAPLGWDSGGGRGFAAVWPMGVLTFAVCGILAGAIGVSMGLLARQRGNSTDAP